MGMFDSVEVLANKVGIDAGSYQTKCLGCTLAHMTIGEDGCIIYTPPGSMNESGYASDRENEEVMQIKDGGYGTSGDDPYEDWLTIYGDGHDGKWVEYYLRIENCRIVKVLKWDEVVFNTHDPE